MSLVSQKQGKNNGSWWIFVIIIFIATFPYSLFVLIFGAIIYFNIFKNLGNGKTGESIFKKYGDALKKSNPELFETMKRQGAVFSPQKKLKNIDTAKIKEEVLEAVIANKRMPNEEFLQNKIENIFLQNDLEADFDTRQKILEGAYEEFAKIQQEEQRKELESRQKPKKYDYNKNRKTNYTTKKAAVKKYTPKKMNTNTDFPSIWDEYESVIDIMERDKI